MSHNHEPDSRGDSQPASPLRPKAFRFKGEGSSSRRSSSPSKDDEKSTSRRHRRHRSLLSRRRRKHTQSPSPAHPHPRPRSRSRSPGPPPRDLSPDTAFRESLFDAMADDEGAAYWEGVYGQPIHVYPPQGQSQQSGGQSGDAYEGSDYNNPDVLDADAYAAYVRRKMWEKSHEHILEEREKRAQRAREDRKRREASRRHADEADRLREAQRRQWADGSRDNGADFGSKTNSFAEDLEAGIRRGEKRRMEKRWRQAWSEYTERWQTLRVKTTDNAEGGKKADEGTDNGDEVQLPWPVLTGKERDVDADGVKAFLNHVHLHSSSPEALRAQLKLERVRWHPDKVMQRFRVDERTLQGVTAVFQVIDQMWNEGKSKV